MMPRIVMLTQKHFKAILVEHMVDNHGWKAEDAENYTADKLPEVHQQKHRDCRFLENAAAMDKVSKQAFAKAFREIYQADFPMVTTDDVIRRIDTIAKTQQLDGILDELIILELLQTT